MLLAAVTSFAAASAAAAQLVVEPPFAAEGLALTFHLVPVEYWDAAEGPLGHELPAGTVRLYRQGRYEAEIEGEAGRPIVVPPGEWLWIAEAPGFVSTFTNRLSVGAGAVQTPRSFTVPMTPACRLRLVEDRRWRGIERLDVVSLGEAAVYPLRPAERRELWVPAGSHLAYVVRRGVIQGIGPIGFCRRDETAALPYPEPPPEGSQSLVVTARLAESVGRQRRDELLVELADPRLLAAAPPLAPVAGMFQGASGVFFFLDVPALDAYRLTLRHPLLRTTAEAVEPRPGTVREIGVGELLERRELKVGVDYRPARQHGSAALELRRCGDERSPQPAMLLHATCGQPLDSHPLRPGVHTYRFPSLDDGQYLIGATIDDEVVPGLGEELAPFLAPGSLAEPIEAGGLIEMHVHGRLLLDGEAVPGVVRLAAWSEESGIPSRSMPTEDDGEYHLYYFARLPGAGEVLHFPEALRDEAPEDLPGLYCSFQVSACSEAGACRTFNLHSAFTGEGRFDLELPGEEAVEVRAVDAATGEAVPGARMLVAASPAFHFVAGEVVWFEAAGAEPDGLDLDAGGRVTWLPPAPGRHRVYVHAAGYATGSAQVDVPPGGVASVTLELDRESYVAGARLLFADGTPVANGRLLAFGADGGADPACLGVVDGEGFTAPPVACAGHTYLLVHPWAALEVVGGREVVGSAVVEVRRRPPFPPRVRLVDDDGEPVRDAFIQIRLDELTLTPDALFAAAAAGLPFLASNAYGEIVLNGLDSGRLFDVQVSPWPPYEERWVGLDGAGGPVELVARRRE